MPLNFHISYPDSKYKNPFRTLYNKIWAIKTSKKKHSIITAENVIFKDNSECANLIAQITNQRVIQNELHNKIYTLLDQYKTSVNYTNMLEEECKNLYKPYNENPEFTEESIDVCIPTRPYCKRVLDLISDCFIPSTTKSCMRIFQGL